MQLPEAAFDVVLDLVGGPNFPNLLNCLKNGGRYAVAGAIAGPIVELDLRTLYLEGLWRFLAAPDRIRRSLKT